MKNEQANARRVNIYSKKKVPDIFTTLKNMFTKKPVWRKIRKK